MLPSGDVSLRKKAFSPPPRALARRARRADRTVKDEGLGTTVAFLAECQGSASIDEQKASLRPDDHVVIAGKQSFTKLEGLLSGHGMELRRGDRIKVYDLSCIALSTTTLVRLLTRMLRNGVSFEIIAAGIVIEPDGKDKLHALLDALDGHYRHVHGVKTHPADNLTRGRRRLLEPEKLPEIRAKLETPGVTATEVAQELGVARSTLFNFLERYDVDRRLGRGKKTDEADAERAGDKAHLAQAEAREGSC